jgi:4-diphosphocytidyl-2-C-methyl-D-erythritol kinase
MRALRLRAHAKINWTLEVLGKRSDGYHEVRTIMQTIDLADTITLRDADDISLSITGGNGALAGEPVEENLAYRAALLLRGESKRGVHIELEKRIPIAMGLGGGSSDAAAVLRGLRVLWALDISDEKLASLAAELGSDVPFFLHGGRAIASGRGEEIESLPDAAEQRLVVAWPDGAQDAHKTATMYARLSPAHYTDGIATEVLAARVREGKTIDEGDLYNVFEQVLNPEGTSARLSPASTATAATSHLCGSGPAMYFLVASQEAAEFMALGVPYALTMKGVATRTISSAESLTIEELP